MKIVYFGSSNFSVPFLGYIHGSSHELVRVITRPDKKTGRGRKIIMGPVKQRAVELGIDILETDRIDSSFIDSFSSIDFDFAVVVSFGLIFPEKLFKDTAEKWLNLHPSLLPSYRGPAPIISALLNGDRVTGASINEVVYRVDTGRIYAQAKFGIEAGNNREDLEEKVIKFGGPLMISVLDLIEEKGIKPYPQDESKVTYTNKITSKDLKINWKDSGGEIVNRIRAFSPAPGAYCLWKGDRLKILKAVPVDAGKGPGAPGEIITADKNSGITVRCNNDSVIKLCTLKPQGKKTMADIDFINGSRPGAGERFE